MRFKCAAVCLTAVILSISFTACGFGKNSSSSSSSLSSSVSSSQSSVDSKPDASTPQGTAQIALDAFKALDTDTLAQYVEYENGNNLFGGKMEGTNLALAQALVKKFSYQLGAVTVEGETATIPTKLVNADLTGVIKDFTAAAVADALKNGGKPSSTDAYVEKLTEMIEQAGDETKTMDVDLKLVKKAGAWKLKLDTTALNAISGGMLDMVSQFEGLIKSVM